MLPDPLVAIEESVASLESRLDDHLKVYQTSGREKDNAIASLREELGQIRYELSQITVEAAQKREMCLNALHSTEEKLKKKMQTILRSIEQSDSEKNKQRGRLNKVGLDIHTLQIHSVRQAQKLRRVQILQIELQRAVEGLKLLPSLLKELEAEQARLYDMLQLPMTPCTPRHGHIHHPTLHDELGALVTSTKFSPLSTSLSSVTDEVLPQDDSDITPRNQPFKFSDPFAINTGQVETDFQVGKDVIRFQLGGSESTCPPVLESLDNFTRVSVWQAEPDKNTTWGKLHLPIVSNVKGVMQHILLHVRELGFNLSHMYQSTFSGDFTSFTYDFKQPLDNGQLPLLLASGVLGILILGRTMHALSAGTQNTNKLQYWSPGDGFVVHPL